MFVSKEIIFVELHKTACTHIGKLLGRLLDGRQTGKHNPVPAELMTGGHAFLGSVRNPWEWYISLWAYGCDKKGAVYHAVTRKRRKIHKKKWRAQPLDSLLTYLTDGRREPEKWARCYRDAHDPEAFREWLAMVHDEKHWNDFGEGYGRHPMARTTGLFSYRYLRLFCREVESPEFHQLADPAGIAAFEREHCFIDHFIRNESLEANFIETLEKCGIPLTEADRAMVLSGGKTNTSSRKAGVEHFYDAASVELVRRRDSLIIEKFGYPEPAV